MKSYNFTQCENPHIIRNKYTGDVIRVGCGCCRGCALQRRDRMSLLCRQEEQNHLYTLFVTLTFNPDTLPLLQPIRKDFGERHGYKFYNLCHRYQNLGSQVHFEPDSYHQTSDWLEPLLKKTNLGGFLPFVTVRDAQLFMKRLRKFLSKYSNEKIKYYLVSEYGPAHFRPHFHVLLFFDEEQTKRYIGRCILLAWAYHQKTRKTFSSGKTKTIYKLRRFGRIDYSYTQGHASSYVSSYVNCSVRLPKFYSYAIFARPFCLHSQNFGNPLSKTEKEEIYKDESFSFTSLSIQTDEKLHTYELQSTFKSRFFPKCRGFSYKSFSELYQTYSAFNKLSTYFGSDNINCLSNIVYSLLCSNSEHPIIESFKIYTTCQDYQPLNPDIDSKKLFINKIKTDLYLSKHFHKFVCDGDIRLYHQRIKQICAFWNHDAQSKLSKFYITQNEFMNDFITNRDFLPYMYSNFEKYYIDHIFQFDGDLYSYYLYENFEDFTLKCFNQIFNTDFASVNIDFKPILKQHSMYNNIMSDVSIRFNKSIKHKLQNDLNNVLNNL